MEFNAIHQTHGCGAHRPVDAPARHGGNGRHAHAPDHHSAVINHGVRMGAQGMADQLAQQGAAGERPAPGATPAGTYAGQALPTDGSKYTIGGATFGGHPPTNNNGPEDPRYAGMYDQYYQRLADKYGKGKLDTAIKVLEDGYQDNGIPTTLPEYSHHDKAIHFLIEQLDGNLGLDPGKLAASQNSQRANYGAGGAHMADAAAAARDILGAP